MNKDENLALGEMNHLHKRAAAQYVNQRSRPFCLAAAGMGTYLAYP